MRRKEQVGARAFSVQAKHGGRGPVHVRSVAGGALPDCPSRLTVNQLRLARCTRLLRASVRTSAPATMAGLSDIPALRRLRAAVARCPAGAVHSGRGPVRVRSAVGTALPNSPVEFDGADMLVRSTAEAFPVDAVEGACSPIVDADSAGLPPSGLSAAALALRNFSAHAPVSRCPPIPHSTAKPCFARSEAGRPVWRGRYSVSAKAAKRSVRKSRLPWSQAVSFAVFR